MQGERGRGPGTAARVRAPHIDYRERDDGGDFIEVVSDEDSEYVDGRGDRSGRGVRGRRKERSAANARAGARRAHVDADERWRPAADEDEDDDVFEDAAPPSRKAPRRGSAAGSAGGSKAKQSGGAFALSAGAFVAGMAKTAISALQAAAFAVPAHPRIEVIDLSSTGLEAAAPPPPPPPPPPQAARGQRAGPRSPSPPLAEPAPTRKRAHVDEAIDCDPDSPAAAAAAALSSRRARAQLPEDATASMAGFAAASARAASSAADAAPRLEPRALQPAEQRASRQSSTARPAPAAGAEPIDLELQSDERARVASHVAREPLQPFAPHLARPPARGKAAARFEAVRPASRSPSPPRRSPAASEQPPPPRPPSPAWVVEPRRRDDDDDDDGAAAGATGADAGESGTAHVVVDDNDDDDDDSTERDGPQRAQLPEPVAPLGGARGARSAASAAATGRASAAAVIIVATAGAAAPRPRQVSRARSPPSPAFEPEARLESIRDGARRHEDADAAADDRGRRRRADGDGDAGTDAGRGRGAVAATTVGGDDLNARLKATINTLDATARATSRAIARVKATPTPSPPPAFAAAAGSDAAAAGAGGGERAAHGEAAAAARATTETVALADSDTDAADAAAAVAAVAAAAAAAAALPTSTAAGEAPTAATGAARRAERRALAAARSAPPPPAPDTRVLVYPHGPHARRAVQLFTSDIARLQGAVFLNDSLVDFCLRYAEAELASDEATARVHVFSSFWLAKARQASCEARARAAAAAAAAALAAADEGAAAAAPAAAALAAPAPPARGGLDRWTRGVDLFGKDLLLVPVHDKVNLHWALAVVAFAREASALPRAGGAGSAAGSAAAPAAAPAADGADASAAIALDDDSDAAAPPAADADAAAECAACVLYFDSLGGLKRWPFKLIAEQLAHEWTRRRDAAVGGSGGAAAGAAEAPPDFLKMPLVQYRIPLQTNAVDCGLFLVECAEQLLAKPPSRDDVLAILRKARPKPRPPPPPAPPPPPPRAARTNYNSSGGGGGGGGSGGGNSIWNWGSTGPPTASTRRTRSGTPPLDGGARELLLEPLPLPQLQSEQQRFRGGASGQGRAAAERGASTAGEAGLLRAARRAQRKIEDATAGAAALAGAPRAIDLVGVDPIDLDEPDAVADAVRADADAGAGAGTPVPAALAAGAAAQRRAEQFAAAATRAATDGAAAPAAADEPPRSAPATPSSPRLSPASQLEAAPAAPLPSSSRLLPIEQLDSDDDDDAAPPPSAADADGGGALRGGAPAPKASREARRLEWGAQTGGGQQAAATQPQPPAPTPTHGWSYDASDWFDARALERDKRTHVQATIAQLRDLAAAYEASSASTLAAAAAARRGADADADAAAAPLPDARLRAMKRTLLERTLGADGCLDSVASHGVQLGLWTPRTLEADGGEARTESNSETLPVEADDELDSADDGARARRMDDDDDDDEPSAWESELALVRPGGGARARS